MKIRGLKVILAGLIILSSVNMQADIVYWGGRRRPVIERVIRVVEKQPKVIVVKERSSERDAAAIVDLAVNAYEHPVLTAAVISGLVIVGAALSTLRPTRTDYVVVEESRPVTTVYLEEEPECEIIIVR